MVPGKAGRVIIVAEILIETLVEKARAALKEIETYSQEQIDTVCKAIAWEMYKDDNIEKLAEEAVAETAMGNVPDKIKKHKGKVLESSMMLQALNRWD